MNIKKYLITCQNRIKTVYFDIQESKPSTDLKSQLISGLISDLNIPRDHTALNIEHQTIQRLYCEIDVTLIIIYILRTISFGIGIKYAMRTTVEVNSDLAYQTTLSTQLISPSNCVSKIKELFTQRPILCSIIKATGTRGRLNV